ncbi:MAG: hypothetical protein ACRCW9_03055 [Cetobacterium sp.]
MPIAITSFKIVKDFDTNFNSQIDYLNNNTLRIEGKIRRTPGDNIVFVLHYGLREEFNKNPSIKILVNEDGNFAVTVNLDEGEGKYYLTCRLLLDDGSYDLLNTYCFYKTNAPKIDNLEILNYDSLSVDPITKEKIYIIKEKLKKYLNFSFTTYLNDLESKSFYKLWLSTEEEPDYLTQITTNKTNKEINISELINGDYYIYLKVTDLSDNSSFKKIKLYINREESDIKINYLQLVNKDYYIDLNKIENPIKLLVEVQSGLNIKEAEYQLFEGDNLLISKNKEEFDQVNLRLLDELNHSGFYYLEQFDINKYFDLLDGEYNLKIHFKDEFKKDYYSNYTKLKVKSNISELYTDDLNIDNLSSLVMSHSNKIKFYLKDDFFSIANKQIKVTAEINNKIINCNSKNTFWKEEQEGLWSTELELFLDNKNINFDGFNFKDNIYTFSIENDYFEVSQFKIPLVYKAKKNFIRLTDSFIKENKFINFVNEEKNNGEFLISNSLEFFNLNIEILNEVEFSAYPEYKTHNNCIKVLISGNEEIKDFSNPNDIWIDLEFNNEHENHEESYEPLMEEIQFELSTNESYRNSLYDSDISYFNVKLYDDDRFNIEHQEVKIIGTEKELLLEFPGNLKIKNNNFVTTRSFNSTYSYLTFKKQNNFSANGYKDLEFFECLLYEESNKQKEINYTFTVDFYKDLSTIYQDIKINNFIKDEYFDLDINLPYENIDKDLYFYFDCENKVSNEKDFVFDFNTHQYEIVNVLGINKLRFKDLNIVPFLSEGSYSFVCYYKYKDVDEIKSFNIEYDFKITKEEIKIFQLTNPLNIKDSNFISFNNEEIQVDKLTKIELWYNNKNKDTILKTKDFQPKFDFKLNNEYLKIPYTNLKAKAYLFDGNIVESNILNIKTINKDNIINILMSNTKFGSYDILSKSKVQFIPKVNTKIIIETKLKKIFGLNSDSTINNNEKFEVVLNPIEINKKTYLSFNKIFNQKMDSGYYEFEFNIKNENNQDEIKRINFYLTEKDIFINSVKTKSKTVNKETIDLEFDISANDLDKYELYYLINDKKKIVKNNKIELDKDIQNQKIEFFILNKTNKKLNSINWFLDDNDKINNQFELLNTIEIKKSITINNKELFFDLVYSSEFYFINIEEFDLINKNEHLFIYVDNEYKETIEVFDLKKNIKIIDLIDHLDSIVSFSILRNELKENTSSSFIEKRFLNSFNNYIELENKKVFKLKEVKKINLKTEIKSISINDKIEFNHIIPCHIKFRNINEKIIKQSITFEQFNKLMKHKYFKNKNVEFKKFYFDLAMIKLKSESIFNKLNEKQKELINCILVYEFNLLYPNYNYDYDLKQLNQLKNKINVMQIKEIIKTINGVDILNENIY